MSNKALSLAEYIELGGDYPPTLADAAAALRAQHALIAELVALLRELRGSLAPTYRMSPEGRAYLEKMDAALSKAKEQS